MYRRPRHPIRRHSFAGFLARSAIKGGAVFAAIATGLVGCTVGATLRTDAGRDPMVSRPYAAGSPTAVIAAHPCWTGPAPADMAGRLPGHVVVELPGGDGVTYGGEQLVAQALDQVFNHQPHGLTVYAFCR